MGEEHIPLTILTRFFVVCLTTDHTTALIN